MELLQNNNDSGINTLNSSSGFLKPMFCGEVVGSVDDLNLEEILESDNLLDIDRYE